MSTDERRAPGTTRVPYEGLVEVGGAAEPTFEAQAVNVSEEGIQVRSAYLPEPGQQLSCRFDVPGGQSVLAAGEVAWARAANRGGELGIRFTEMDPESVAALKHALGPRDDSAPPAAPGAKVRLHVEGLASPMRAKIRDSRTNEITVGSELGFLRVGNELQLEDPQSGEKRPASIDAVEVVIDPESRVPQLVVTLRYADAEPSAPVVPASTRQAAEGEEAAPVASPSDDHAGLEDAARTMKGGFARAAAQIGPALARLANQAKTTVALLAQRGRDPVGAGPSPRRTTAPPPGGGLHTSGRRVVRGEAGPSPADAVRPRGLFTKRKAAAMAGGVMVAAVLGALVLKSTHHEGAPKTADTVASEVIPPSAPPTASAAIAAASSATQAAPGLPAAEPAPAPGGLESQVVASDDGADLASKAAHKKQVHVAPFGNGPVRHGNVIQLKMDGPIESLEGAQQPTGFAVKIPGRKSLEAAGPLAARDSRIAAMKVTNDAAGAQLTVVFKDGVPNYRVSAHGETLVIALASPGALSDGPVANKDEAGSTVAKRAKSGRDREKGDKRANLPRLPAPTSRENP